MIEPKKISFYVYTEKDSDIEDLEKTLHDFVVSYYRNGVLVTAKALTSALKRFGNSPMIKHYLNGKQDY